MYHFDQAMEKHMSDKTIKDLPKKDESKEKPIKPEDLEKVVGGMPPRGGGTHGTVSDTGSEVDDT